MKLNGKVVVVTGAGSGMGRELALELLRRQARVAAVDISEKGLAETLSLAGERARDVGTFPCNIADRAAVEALPQQVQERFGAVDGLINCAGIIQPFKKIHELDYATIDRVFSVNWLGTLYLTKTFLPVLLERPEGHVVNISSMGGFLPVPGQTVYGASKAAVKLFTEGLHSELADTKVRVMVVFPGAIGTNIMANSGVAMSAAHEKNRNLTYPPDKAARDILNGMERNRFRMTVGKDAWFLDLIYRLNPRRAAWFIAQAMKRLMPS